MADPSFLLGGRPLCRLRVLSSVRSSASGATLLSLSCPTDSSAVGPSSSGIGLWTRRGARIAEGTTTSGNMIDAGCVPGRRPTERDVSCSLMARSRSRLCRSIYSDVLSDRTPQGFEEEKLTRSQVKRVKFTFSFAAVITSADNCAIVMRSFRVPETASDALSSECERPK